MSNGATCCNPVEVVVLEGSEPVLVSLSHRMLISLVISVSQIEDVFITHTEDVFNLGDTSLGERSSQCIAGLELKNNINDMKQGCLSIGCIPQIKL